MKKTITSREFVRQFGKIQARLKPGESVTITRQGKRLGEYVKEPPRRFKLPDFEKLAKAAGFGPEVGDELLKRILADEADG